MRVGEGEEKVALSWGRQTMGILARERGWAWPGQHKPDPNPRTSPGQPYNCCNATWGKGNKLPLFQVALYAAPALCWIGGRQKVSLFQHDLGLDCYCFMIK